MTTAVAHEITTNNVSKTTATTDVPITTVTTGVPTSTVTTDIPDNQVETTPFIENGGGFAGGPRGKLGLGRKQDTS